MKQDGFKYAELPGGKLLKFPDGTSDKEIQRAVRRELGLTQEDMLATFDRFVERMTEILDHAGKQDDRDKKIVEQVADALQTNANRIAGEVSDALRELRAILQEFETSLRKTMSSQNTLIIKLDTAVNSLNSTLDAALGQSLAAMDEGHATTRTSAANMDRSVNALAGLVQRLGQTVDEMKARRQGKRRAYRERDGSWTMEMG